MGLALSQLDFSVDLTDMEDEIQTYVDDAICEALEDSIGEIERRIENFEEPEDYTDEIESLQNKIQKLIKRIEVLENAADRKGKIREAISKFNSYISYHYAAACNECRKGFNFLRKKIS